MVDQGEALAKDLSQFYGTAAQVIPALLLILTLETTFLRWILDSATNTFVGRVQRATRKIIRMIRRSVSAGNRRPPLLLIAKAFLLVTIPFFDIGSSFLFVFAPLVLIASVGAEGLSFYQLAAGDSARLDELFSAIFIGVTIVALLVGVLLALMRALFATSRLAGMTDAEFLFGPESPHPKPDGASVRFSKTARPSRLADREAVVVERVRDRMLSAGPKMR